MPLLYLETNYLVGVATGRYPEVTALLPAVPPSVRLILPSACVMEALAAVENEQSRRRSLTGQLDYQIKQLVEGVESPRAVALVAKLEQARVENDALVNDIQARLFDAITSLTTVAGLIDPGPATIRQSLQQQLVAQPTDNLILHTITSQAAGAGAEQKVFFTANVDDFRRGEAGRALIGSGVRKFLRTYASLLRWLSYASTH